MRTREEKDEQTVDIAAALLGAAALSVVVVAVLGGLVWVTDLEVDAPGVILPVGFVLIVLGLLRSRRRR